MVWLLEGGGGGSPAGRNSRMIGLGMTIQTKKNLSRSISSLFFIAYLHFMNVLEFTYAYIVPCVFC